MAGAATGSSLAVPPAAGFTALVLAGSRPGGDPLARASGVTHKALVPVAGTAMLTRVVATLRAVRAVRRVVVCGIGCESLGGQPELIAQLDDGHLALIGAAETPSASVQAALRTLAPCTPLLVTTADHPLLSAALVDDFCVRSAASEADVTVGLVSATLVRDGFPTIQRTAIPFRGGSYCGSNLYAFLNPSAERAAAAWRQVERHRKQPWRLVAALGIGVTLRFLLRRLTLDDVIGLASQRMGVRARAVLLTRPEAGFDIDTPAQLAAAEAFLRARAPSLS